jgi:hypothetical protein
MLNHARHHIRANIVGYVALFFALSLGTAWALERNSVKSKHIADGQVKSKDVKDNGLLGADIDESSLQLGQITTASGPAGGDLTGSYPKPAIAGNAVNSAKTQNGSLTGEDVANDSLDGFDVQGLSGADMQANTLTGDQVNESTLGEVPRATIAGHGGYGRQSGEPVACDPTDDLWHTCASVALTPTAPARFLVTGRFFAGSQLVGPGADGEGQCRLGISGTGAIPGTTNSVNVEDGDGDWVTITGITDAYQPGNYTFGLDCRQTAGFLTTNGAHVSAVAISPF